jgi:hypothetical protein
MNTTPKANPKNRYELNQMADGFSAFVESYPSFNQTKILDEWRETQYNRLDANGQIYLDYTGGGLYSEMQLCEHMELLRTRVLGNPHSGNPTSLAMTDLVEGIPIEKGESGDLDLPFFISQDLIFLIFI